MPSPSRCMKVWPRSAPASARPMRSRPWSSPAPATRPSPPGTDIAQFQAFKGSEDGIAYERKIDRILDTIERCSVPTIAAIAGFCTGGGAAIAAVCDLRPRHHQRPVRLSHRPHARQLPVDGQLRPAGRPDRPAAHQGGDLPAKLIDGPTALSIGLVRAPADAASLHARAEEWPARWPAMPDHPPGHQGGARRLQARLGDDDIDDLIRLAYGSQDFREGMAAFLAKRAPKRSGT